MDLASGVAPFLSLASEIVVIANMLCQTITRYKKVPEILKRAHREVMAVQEILASFVVTVKSTQQLFEVGEQSRAAIHKAMKECDDEIGWIIIFVQDFWDPLKSRSLRIRKRLQMAALGNGELEGYIQKLEKAKSNLALALQCLNLVTTQEVHRRHLKHNEDAMSSLHSVFATVMDTNNVTHDISDTVFELKRDVAEAKRLIKRTNKAVSKIPGQIEFAMNAALRDMTMIFDGYYNDRRRALPRMAHLKISRQIDFRPKNHNRESAREGPTLFETLSEDNEASTAITRRRVSTFTVKTPFVDFRKDTVIEWLEDVSKPEPEALLIQKRSIIRTTTAPLPWLMSWKMMMVNEKIGYLGPRLTVFTVPQNRVVPYDSLILTACQNHDISKIQELFRTGRASPFDVDSYGEGLLHHAMRHSANKKMYRTVELLLSQGVDPVPALPFILQKHSWEESDFCHSHWMFGGGGNEWEQEVCRWMGRIAERAILGEGDFDALDDPTNLLNAWKRSPAVVGNFPLNTNFLESDEKIRLHELAFDYTDEIFSDLMVVSSPWKSDLDTAYQTMHDYRFKVLKYLCDQGIKSKLFNASRGFTNQRIKGKLSCRGNSNHLLFDLLVHSGPGTHDDTLQRRLIRRHVQRMLILLIQTGDDPCSHCSCEARWNPNQQGSRSLVCLAAEEGMLIPLRNAIDMTSGNATPMIDEWLFAGVRHLFNMAEGGLVQDQVDTGCSCSKCLSPEERGVDQITLELAEKEGNSNAGTTGFHHAGKLAQRAVSVTLSITRSIV